jgi:hypothetical protein
MFDTPLKTRNAAASALEALILLRLARAMFRRRPHEIEVFKSDLRTTKQEASL